MLVRVCEFSMGMVFMLLFPDARDRICNEKERKIYKNIFNQQLEYEIDVFVVHFKCLIDAHNCMFEIVANG